MRTDIDFFKLKFYCPQQMQKQWAASHQVNVVQLLIPPLWKYTFKLEKKKKVLNTAHLSSYLNAEQ